MEVKLFVPLGTQKFPFGRLIKALNQLVDEGKYSKDEIVMQSTVYPMKPKFLHMEMIPADEFNCLLKEAEVVITHSGVNSIITCMQLKKPLVVVPRRCKYGEHVDDHQMEIANLMKEKYDVIMLEDMNALEASIELAKTHKYKPWLSHRTALIEAVKEMIV